MSGMHFSLLVSFAAIVRGLVTDTDFLVLAQLLCAVTLCAFPSRLIRNLIDRLDFVLPGEDGRLEKSKSTSDDVNMLMPKRKWWRSSLAHEKPRIVYHEQRAASFRGPVCKAENIRVSARVAQATLFADSTGGFRLLLTKTSHGVDSTLTLDIPKNMLFRVVKGALLASNNVRTMTSKATSYSSILNPDRRADLFRFLWCRLRITDEDSANREAHGMSQARRQHQVRRLGAALLSFERWVFSSDPALRPFSTARLLGEITKAQTGSLCPPWIRQAEALVLDALPCSDSHMHTQLSSSWMPAVDIAPEPCFIEPYTAHIALDGSGNFFVALSEASDTEIASRAISLEGDLMAREDVHDGTWRAMFSGQARITSSVARTTAKNMSTALHGSAAARVAVAARHIAKSQDSDHGISTNFRRLLSLWVRAALPCLRVLMGADHMVLLLSSTCGSMRKREAPRGEKRQVDSEIFDCKVWPELIAKHAVMIPVPSSPLWIESSHCFTFCNNHIICVVGILLQPLVFGDKVVHDRTLDRPCRTPDVDSAIPGLSSEVECKPSCDYRNT
mmetsp:Transcript_27650/g.85407  ORF Transcript_27650/g.85407 Transcript_27650/m.85407 type:complete len:560 (-) Transcript_27650:2940-4619(-)